MVEIKSIPARTRMLQEGRKLAAMNWKDRLNFTTALLFPTPDYIRWRYEPLSNWFLPFYYLIRWKDIFLDGLRTIIYLAKIRTK
jgi:hypothetical protein